MWLNFVWKYNIYIELIDIYVPDPIFIKIFIKIMIEKLKISM